MWGFCVCAYLIPLLLYSLCLILFATLGTISCTPREQKKMIAIFSPTATDDWGLKSPCRCADLLASVGFYLI